METWAVVLVCVTSGLNIVAATFSAFFKGYAGKKGENFATKEDLKDVVDQVKAVTRTQEEIKTELSEKTWSKQRHWDLKRDTALEIMRSYAVLLEACRSAVDISVKHTITPRYAKQMSQEERDEFRQEENAVWNDVQSKMVIFWQLEQISALVFSSEITVRMEVIKDIFYEIRSEAQRIGNNRHTLLESVKEKQSDLVKQIRAELGT